MPAAGRTQHEHASRKGFWHAELNRLLAVPSGPHVDAAIDGPDHVAREFKRAVLLVCQFDFTLARTQRAGVFILRCDMGSYGAPRCRRSAGLHQHRRVVNAALATPHRISTCKSRSRLKIAVDLDEGAHFTGRPAASLSSMSTSCCRWTSPLPIPSLTLPLLQCWACFFDLYASTAAKSMGEPTQWQSFGYTSLPKVRLPIQPAYMVQAMHDASARTAAKVGFLLTTPPPRNWRWLCRFGTVIKKHQTTLCMTFSARATFGMVYRRYQVRATQELSACSHPSRAAS